MPEHLDRAIQQHRKQDFAAAEQSYQAALSEQPLHAGAWHLSGVLAHQTRRVDEAVARFQRALAVDDQPAGYHYNHGLALADLGQREEALAAFEQAAKRNPEHLEAKFQIGCLRHEQGMLQAAAEALVGCVQRQEAWSEAWTRLGAVLQEMGHLNEAVEAYRMAMRHASHDAGAMSNLATALAAQGAFDEAEQWFDRALAAEPPSRQAGPNKAALLLLQGKLSRGWQQFGSRWQLPDRVDPTTRYPAPVWRGESLTGKWLWIHGEQGLGDQVMFATCLPDVLAAADRCTLTCDPRLAALFRRSYPGLEVHGVMPGQTVFNWHQSSPDYQVNLGSLPGVLRNSFDAFPTSPRLLQVDESLSKQWESRLAALGEGLKIGMSWLGGADPHDVVMRSCGLAAWADLLRLPGVHWINLQHGAKRSQAHGVTNHGRRVIHNFGEDVTKDIDSLAALISELDLVISVSNTNVHLAGAVGTEAWNLLPQFTGWRWFLGQEQSHWYGSVKLLRQRSMGDFTDVMHQARTQLEARLRRKREP